MKHNFRRNPRVGTPKNNCERVLRFRYFDPLRVREMRVIVLEARYELPVPLPQPFQRRFRGENFL